MKVSKLSIVIGVLALAWVPFSHAAKAPPSEGAKPRKQPPSVQESVEQMKSGLNLSDEQAAKITGILQQRADARAECMKNKEQTREERQAAMQKIDSSYNEQVRVVLNPQQRGHYDTYVAAKKQEREERQAAAKQKREANKDKKAKKDRKPKTDAPAAPESSGSGDE